MNPSSALTGTAFATLLLIAFMMGANHVAARLAFDNGMDVASAVFVRSSVTALVVAALVAHQRLPIKLDARQRRALLLIGALVAAQSLCLYSAVAHWGRIGAGVAFAVAAAALFGLALVLTQHETAALDGRVRTAATLGLVALLTLVVLAAQAGWRLPQAPAGWFGLGALTFFYGTAFTLMFTVLPRLGVVRYSAILNVEPIFALLLAWALLGQSIAPLQVAGGLIVVASVVWLGLRQR